MKPLFSLALAAAVAFASLPPAVAAQAQPQPQPQPAPQEAQAPVPPTIYHSAFVGYRPAAEDDATPDQTWRAGNDKVGKAGGHMGMMKSGGQAMQGHKMPLDEPSPKPDAKPAAQPVRQHQHEGH